MSIPGYIVSYRVELNHSYKYKYNHYFTIIVLTAYIQREVLALFTLFPLHLTASVFALLEELDTSSDV